MKYLLFPPSRVKQLASMPSEFVVKMLVMSGQELLHIQYLLTSDMGAAGYAMILTAMAADKKVCFIAQAKTTNSLITKLSIKN